MNGFHRIFALGLSLALTAACAGGGGGGSSTAPGAVPSLPALPASAARGAAAFGGVACLTPRDAGFQVEWMPLTDAAGNPNAFQYQVFLSTDGSAPDLTQPWRETAPGVDRVNVDGLAPGSTLRVVVRAVDRFNMGQTDELDTNESELRGRVNQILYVDREAPVGGDGGTAETALQTIAQAVAAAPTGGARVLIVAGLFRESLVLPGGVDLYGGYPPSFTTRRNSRRHATRLRPALADDDVIRIEPSSWPTVLDGLEIDGALVSRSGIVAAEADLSISNCVVFHFTDEGIRLSSQQRTSKFHLFRVGLAECGSEGLEASGAFDARVVQCSVSRNLSENLQFDDLSVQPAGRSRLWLERTTIWGAGEAGLDVDLAALDPADVGSSTGGEIEVVIQDCEFSHNGQSGLYLRASFTATDQIRATSLISNNLLRAQRQNGIELHLAAPMLNVLTGNRTSGNRWLGMAVSSTAPGGTLLMTNHWDLGSVGLGLSIEGPLNTYLSHAAFTGSVTGSLQGNGSIRLVNGAVWLNLMPQDTSVAFSFLATANPGPTNLAGAPQVRRAPVEFIPLAATDRGIILPVPGGSDFRALDTLEIDDDGVRRTVIKRLNGGIEYQPLLTEIPVEGVVLTRFEGDRVDEDASVPSGSTWIDAGEPLERDADGSRTDIGIRGGLLDGFRASPGGPAVPFVVERLSPDLGTVTGVVTRIELTFTRPLDPASTTGGAIEVRHNGKLLAGSAVVQDEVWQLTAAPAIAAGDLEVVVRGTVRSLDGQNLQLPMRYFTTVR